MPSSPGQAFRIISFRKLQQSSEIWEHQTGLSDVHRQGTSLCGDLGKIYPGFSWQTMMQSHPRESQVVGVGTSKFLLIVIQGDQLLFEDAGSGLCLSVYLVSHVGDKLHAFPGKILTCSKYKRNPDLGKERLYMKCQQEGGGEDFHGGKGIIARGQSSNLEICKHLKDQAGRGCSFLERNKQARMNGLWGSGLSCWWWNQIADQGMFCPELSLFLGGMFWRG